MFNLNDAIEQLKNKNPAGYSRFLEDQAQASPDGFGLFLDPITFDIITEPVYIDGHDTGHVFNKESISAWFKERGDKHQEVTNPLTGKVVELTENDITAGKANVINKLLSNYNFKLELQKYFDNPVEYDFKYFRERILVDTTSNTQSSQSLDANSIMEQIAALLRQELDMQKSQNNGDVLVNFSSANDILDKIKKANDEPNLHPKKYKEALKQLADLSIKLQQQLNNINANIKAISKMPKELESSTTETAATELRKKSLLLEKNKHQLSKALTIASALEACFEAKKVKLKKNEAEEIRKNAGVEETDISGLNGEIGHRVAGIRYANAMGLCCEEDVRKIIGNFTGNSYYLQDRVNTKEFKGSLFVNLYMNNISSSANPLFVKKQDLEQKGIVLPGAMVYCFKKAHKLPEKDILKQKYAGAYCIINGEPSYMTTDVGYNGSNKVTPPAAIYRITENGDAILCGGKMWTKINPGQYGHRDYCESPRAVDLLKSLLKDEQSKVELEQEIPENKNGCTIFADTDVTAYHLSPLAQRKFEATLLDRALFSTPTSQGTFSAEQKFQEAGFFKDFPRLVNLALTAKVTASKPTSYDGEINKFTLCDRYNDPDVLGLDSQFKVVFEVKSFHNLIELLSVVYDRDKCFVLSNNAEKIKELTSCFSAVEVYDTNATLLCRKDNPGFMAKLTAWWDTQNEAIFGTKDVTLNSRDLKITPLIYSVSNLGYAEADLKQLKYFKQCLVDIIEASPEPYSSERTPLGVYGVKRDNALHFSFDYDSKKVLLRDKFEFVEEFSGYYAQLLANKRTLAELFTLRDAFGSNANERYQKYNQLINKNVNSMNAIFAKIEKLKDKQTKVFKLCYKESNSCNELFPQNMVYTSVAASAGEEPDANQPIYDFNNMMMKRETQKNEDKYQLNTDLTNQNASVVGFEAYKKCGYAVDALIALSDNLKNTMNDLDQHAKVSKYLARIKFWHAMWNFTLGLCVHNKIDFVARAFQTAEQNQKNQLDTIAMALKITKQSNSSGGITKALGGGVVVEEVERKVAVTPFTPLGSSSAPEVTAGVGDGGQSAAPSAPYAYLLTMNQ